MRQYKFRINGNEYNVAVNQAEGKVAEVSVNGVAYQVELEETPQGAAPVAPQSMHGGPVPAQAQGAAAPQGAAAQPAAKPAGPARSVTSPLPGVIIEVSVKEGQSVKAGDKVAVIEAMKMENEIQASQDGTVTAIHVSKGDSVLEGAPVVTLS